MVSFFFRTVLLSFSFLINNWEKLKNTFSCIRVHILHFTNLLMEFQKRERDLPIAIMHHSMLSSFTPIKIFSIHHAIPNMLWWFYLLVVKLLMSKAFSFVNNLIDGKCIWKMPSCILKKTKFVEIYPKSSPTKRLGVFRSFPDNTYWPGRTWPELEVPG